MRYIKKDSIFWKADGILKFGESSLEVFGGDAYTAVAVAKKVGSGSWAVYNIFRDHLGTITPRCRAIAP